MTYYSIFVSLYLRFEAGEKTKDRKLFSTLPVFFLISFLLYQNLIAACAAANRAIGTRKGEQET